MIRFVKIRLMKCLVINELLPVKKSIVIFFIFIGFNIHNSSVCLFTPRDGYF